MVASSLLTKRQHLRRLVDSGVIGNQQAIVAYCQMTVQEDDAIIESILIQKAGSISKTVRHIVADRLTIEGGRSGRTNVRIRKCRIALNHTVRWKRNKATKGGGRRYT